MSTLGTLRSGPLEDTALAWRHQVLCNAERNGRPVADRRGQSADGRGTAFTNLFWGDRGPDASVHRPIATESSRPDPHVRRRIAVDRLGDHPHRRIALLPAFDLDALALQILVREKEVLDFLQLMPRDVG